MPSQVKIIAFCCNWCSYAAADYAGIARLDYPVSIRIIRVMCSGMVHPEMVIHALNKGADGVMILGCHPGECHYQSGNTAAENRAEMIIEMLEDFGFEQERFSIGWVSAGEPEQLAQAFHTMHDSIVKLADPAQ